MISGHISIFHYTQKIVCQNLLKFMQNRQGTRGTRCNSKVLYKSRKTALVERVIINVYAFSKEKRTGQNTKITRRNVEFCRTIYGAKMHDMVYNSLNTIRIIVGKNIRRFTKYVNSGQ